MVEFISIDDRVVFQLILNVFIQCGNPIFDAVLANDVDMITLLLDQGADVNAMNSVNITIVVSLFILYNFFLAIFFHF